MGVGHRAGVLRLLLLLAASRGTRGEPAVGRARGASPERGLQPLHRAAPDRQRRAARLAVLSADGDPRLSAGGIRGGRADRPAVPVLGAYRAGGAAGLV